MPRPRIDRTTRRTELTSVAARVFAERGVASTAVSDIVKAAGVAQGTFYLYFDSKDEVVLAVVEQIVDGIVDTIEKNLDAAGTTAVDKLRSLGDAFTAVDEDPASAELSEFLHHPENRPLHDRLAENFTPRLIPLVESLVREGVAEGVFDVPDARAAAWFVLGGLQGAELAGTPTAEMRAAMRAGIELALRALGHKEAAS